MSIQLTWTSKHLIIPDFSSARITLTNLLVYQHYINNFFEIKEQLESIYTDLSKTFDKVNHA